MAMQAVLFDIDGTLIDSNDLHAQAWADAFAEFGKDIPANRVRPHIGKGGDQLLPVFLSPEELARFGEKLERFRGELFQREYLPKVRPFFKVRELLVRLKADRKKIALASSAKAD